MEVRTIYPEPVNGVITVDLRGAVTAPPPGGGTVDPPPTGGGGSGGGTLPSGVVPMNGPYPIHSQMLQDIRVGGNPVGIGFTIPAGTPDHGGTIKVFGLGGGDCNRDRRIDRNGVVWRDWWVDPLGIRTDDDFHVSSAPDDLHAGDHVVVWMRHPDGREFDDRFELLANR